MKLLCLEFVKIDSFIQQHFCMQLRQLIANATANPKEFKIQSKEQFFSTKQKQRRMKKSACFSEQIEFEHDQNTPLDYSLASFRSQDPLSACCKQLESTFGGENSLSFRSKPPKRKRNIRTYNDWQKKEDNDSSSDSESSTNNSMIAINKPSEPFKHQLDTIVKKNTVANSTTIDDFHILGKLGEGSYSEVYRAVQKRSGFVCALKVLEKQKMRELGVMDNVIRQIKLNMFLNHPNIAKLYACFHDQHQYAASGNLYDLIKQPRKNRREKSEEVVKLVGQMCEAVRNIHLHHVIHRDIKPQNILLTMGGVVKICDFGWSIHNPNNQMRLTLCGTPLYLAPQMVAQVCYDESIDIWAIGVITYELMTEQSPFQITQLRDLSKIIHEDIKLEAIDDTKAAGFIASAMQKDPAKRKSIFQLCHHPFLSHFFQSNQTV